MTVQYGVGIATGWMEGLRISIEVLLLPRTGDDRDYDDATSCTASLRDDLRRVL